MGRAIEAAVTAADDLELAGIWTRGASLDDVVATADVLIDFSLPEAHADVLAAIRKQPIPLVCGVSGLDAEQVASMQSLANDLPVLFDRNMSQGIAVLHDAVTRIAAALGDEYTVEIHETHHVHKIDAPSGTALKLGEAIAAARDTDPADIHYESERRGEVPGDHEVILSSATETLTLAHSVTTRQVFADGALVAARWVSNKSSGLFTMHDVLE